MPEYIVYDSTSGGATTRPILRWGVVARASEVAPQATEAGEVAVAVALQPNMEIKIWDEVASSIEDRPFAPGVSIEEQQRILDRRHEFIRAELRESEWAMLSDTPLTVPEQAEWTAYRADLRTYATLNYNEDMTLTKPTTTEF